MNLINFLNNLFKNDGFILEDFDKKKYVIGKPIKENPILIKLLDKMEESYNIPLRANNFR